ncbi:MAG TPA: DUF4160 domain-containing protein [Mycobacteriales bacterium]|nr:DUF4160 domain-containing protein [Mycobacteriales bacterium]
MSPRWATVAGYGLYFYAAERHERPHVGVRRGAEHATVDLVSGELLAGALPPRVLKAVRALLAEHREEALRAFAATLDVSKESIDTLWSAGLAQAAGP